MSDLISLEEMKDAIQKSGYLIEQRVEIVLLNNGYYVQANPAYKDLLTGKSREYDIYATKYININKDNFISPVIICECVNNAQPVVFFTKKALSPSVNRYNIICSGIPVKFYDEDGYYYSLADFANIEKYHHYCSEQISTQYCTFQQKKGSNYWMAIAY